MRIETAEDYAAWAKECREHPGSASSPPAPKPHPNEILTREAVKAGIYPAEKVGVVLDQ